jgi:hypothetical protein
MNKTKLAALGMLTSLICILSVGTHSFSDESGKKEKSNCPNKKIAVCDCPMFGVPTCQGVTVGPFCEQAKGSYIYRDRFPAVNPVLQAYETHDGWDPVAPQVMERCYDLCPCVERWGWFYDPEYDLWFWDLYCATNTRIVIQSFLAPTVPGSQCP